MLRLAARSISRIRKKYSDRPFAVELTNVCNLRCPLCDTGSGYDTRPKGMMALADFKKFLDTCAPVLHAVRFVGTGDPLLHPEFESFVRYAAQKKKKFNNISTSRK